MSDRGIGRVVTTAPPSPGFIGVPIVMHGPFVGENREDIRRLSKLYVEGRMPRISELAEAMSGDRH